MPWTELTFGKHSGNTLPQVLFRDPDWFFWAIEEKVFEKRPGPIRTEARDLCKKACSVKIPGDNRGEMCVEYVIHPPTGKFSHFDIVPRDKPRHEGASPTFRTEVIDMSVPRRIATYDKLGCKHMLKSLKHAVFGNESARVTKKRAEQFFENENNFG